MATQFINSYLDGALFVPTSSVPSLKAYTDKVKIDVSMSCENGADSEIETFFSTSLYSFGNIVELSDVGSLVEEYFRKRNKVADSISIVFDSISIDVHFLYCEYALPESFDLAKSFLIASHVQRVHQDSIIAIATTNLSSGIPFIIKAVGHRIGDNSIAVVEKSVSKDISAEGVTYFSVLEILKWVLKTSDTENDVAIRDVMYFSIEYCGIQKLCYIVPAQAYLTFSFRNIFNVEEFFDVVGVLTTKTDISRETAVCNGCSKQYDRYVNRTYQIDTEPLTNDEVSIFEQLIASHHVCLYLDNTDFDILIDEHTCEHSSADDALTTIKFTWRFAEQRPHIFDSIVNGIMPTRRKIFDETFSPEYE